MPTPAKNLALYEKVVATLPGVDRKGDKIPYTSHNGHMFSQMTDEGSVALRLPKDEVDRFLAKYKTKLHEAYGVVRPEYVIVPQALLEKTSELRTYFAKSHAYVASLKPKKTTRPKKAKK